MSLTKAIQPPEPPPYAQTSSYSPQQQQQQAMGKTKMYAPEQVQRIIMSFIEQQQQNQQDEPKVVTVNPMEILYGFMSFFSSWKQNVPFYNGSSAEMSGEEDSTRFSKADKVDLLSDEDVVNCFVIIMHCIVRDRYMEPVLFTNYIKQSIESIVQMGRLSASRNF